MRGRLELVIAVIAIGMTCSILLLVRRRQLREKYALLWLGVGFGTLLLALARSWLDRLSISLGISYGPSALFLFSTLFLMAVAAHLSWEISRLEERTRRLAEEIALMQAARPEPGDEVLVLSEREPASGAEEAPVAGGVRTAHR